MNGFSIREASELRSAALETLSGNWTEAVIACLIYFIVCAGTSYSAECISSELGSLWSLFMIPMGWSFAVMFLDLIRNKQGAIDLGHLIDGYKDFTRVFFTTLLQNVLIFLWTLLLIIPGIIKSFSYAMTPFILKDYPDVSYYAAINMSQTMMDGHKFDLFYLYLTFIGWSLLCILTLGIGFLWLFPYMQTALAHFYEDVKEEYENKYEE